ncbi:MAG: hypothetical protein U5P41_10095 [Gammaproteobacteria bacterium]|nr:hypothetical protein [Gammaproteobacteria bacterium]
MPVRPLEHLTRLDLDKPPLQGRPLLLPETLSATTEQLARVERWQADLAALALELEQSSPTQVMLRSLPAALPATDAQSLLPALLDCLAATVSTGDLHEHAVGLLAAHAGRCFDASQAAPLLQRLQTALESDRLAPPRPWRTVDAAGLADWLANRD